MPNGISSFAYGEGRFLRGLRVLERRSFRVRVMLTAVLLALPALLDLLFVDEAARVLFVVPVVLAACFFGLTGGFVAGMAAVSISAGVDWLQATRPSPVGAVIALFSWSFLAWATLSLRQSLRRSAALASRDVLTQLANASAFRSLLGREIRRSERHAHPFVLGYLDLDDFKTINDAWGHAAGDAVLRAVGGALRSSIRMTDFAARLGGDEFAVLLPETGASGASRFFERLVQAIVHEVEVGQGFRVAMSVGVVAFELSPHDADEALSIADRCMYAAKERGGETLVFIRVPGGDGTDRDVSQGDPSRNGRAGMT